MLIKKDGHWKGKRIVVQESIIIWGKKVNDGNYFNKGISFILEKVKEM
jgi:hypothetical protein